jgi:hypothetical protein
LTHALGAARENEIRNTGLDLHAAEHDRLQARAAAPVKLKPRYLDRQAGVERSHPADRRGLAVWIALTEKYIVDLLGRQRGALQKLPDDRRRKRRGRDVAENAAETSDGGSERLADHGIAHGRRA